MGSGSPNPPVNRNFPKIAGKKMVKGGCWDIPAFIVGCYGFYVYVQCFFPTFDVLCGGVSGSDFPLTFTVDVWIEWG